MPNSEIRILLIEDTPTDAELLIRHLKKSDLNFCCTVIDELDLIDENITKHDVDLILCDYNLPGFTGADAIQRINTLDKDMPVILVSGAIPDEQAIEAVIAGAKDYVLKDNFTRLVPAIKREYNALLEKRENDKKDLFLSSLFNSQIGIIISDNKHVIHHVNEAYCKLLGYSKQEFMALPLPSIFPEYLREGITKTYDNFIQEGASEVYESKNLHKNGTHINVIASSKKVVTYDSTYVISTVNDITKRKSDEKKILQQNQELTQLKETREKLYTIIGHDLKNALFGISGLLGIILEDKESDVNSLDLTGIFKKLSLLYSSSTNATRLLENLLDWVQMQSGNLIFDKTKYNFSEQILEILNLLQAQASHKGIDIEKNLQKELYAYADHHMMGTVIRNLISNAIKFTKPHGKIEVSATKTEKAIVLVVKDNGIGIPPEIAAFLFDPENRPKRIGTHREKGNGLGLIMVQELIELHNGTITFNSSEGNGTEFLITLPILS